MQEKLLGGKSFKSIAYIKLLRECRRNCFKGLNENSVCYRFHYPPLRCSTEKEKAFLFELNLGCRKNEQVKLVFVTCFSVTFM